MKICFYSGIFARHGGIEVFTRDLALALRHAGIEVRIVCASLKNPILDELKRAGVEIVAVPVFFGCRWNLPDYALLPVAMNALRDADVVIHQKPFKEWFYRLLPSRPKHVFLTAYHPADQFRRKSGDREFFDFFDHIITQTEAFRTDIINRGVKTAVSVLPLFPPRLMNITAADRDKRDPFRFGILGRIEPQKNHAYAVRIVNAYKEHVASSYTGVELHVYGSGMLEQEVRSLADALEVSVVFHGAYHRDDLPQILAENDAFLITSISEGQCIAALEILSAGQPLFACAVGALPEVLNDPLRGELLPPDDERSAATLIAEWFKQYSHLQPADIQASYSRSYDRDQIEDRYHQLLCELGELR